MDRENKYYNIIEGIIKNHRKYSGNESILEEIIDDVYNHSSYIINTIDDENVIKSYIEKVVSTSIITVSRKLRAENKINNPAAELIDSIKYKQAKEENFQKITSLSADKSVMNNLVEKMINSSPSIDEQPQVAKTETEEHSVNNNDTVINLDDINELDRLIIEEEQNSVDNTNSNIELDNLHEKQNEDIEYTILDSITEEGSTKFEDDETVNDTTDELSNETTYDVQEELPNESLAVSENDNIIENETRIEEEEEEEEENASDFIELELGDVDQESIEYENNEPIEDLELKDANADDVILNENLDESIQTEDSELVLTDIGKTEPEADAETFEIAEEPEILYEDESLQMSGIENEVPDNEQLFLDDIGELDSLVQTDIDNTEIELTEEEDDDEEEEEFGFNNANTDDINAPTETENEESLDERYLPFNYNPEKYNFEPNLETTKILSELDELNKNKPELKLMDIYKLKFIKNKSVSEIAEILDLNVNKVIESLNALVDIV